MNQPHALALDVGTRYARLAVAGPGDGPAGPVPLPGEVPGEGLPLSAQARGRPVVALREAYGAYLARYGPPARAVGGAGGGAGAGRAARPGR
ncbi:sugar kinase, partial [Streptomyces sp. NPDC059409]